MPSEPSSARHDRRSICRGLAVGLLVAGAFAPAVGATTLVVPDQAPTIQAALDARPDSVLVRPGTYAETLMVIERVTLMGLSDEPAGRPSVRGLTLHPENWGPFVVRGLRVEGLTFLAGGGVSEFYFTQCDLSGGVSDNIKNYNIWFSQCSIAGPLDLWADSASLDSCQVTGNVINAKSHLTVRGCTLQGGGVSCPRDGGCVVENCAIRGGGIGIRSSGDGLNASNNVIEGCRGAAVLVDGSDATITNNVIRNCGAGIDVSYAGGLSVVGNSVTNIVGTGLAVGEGDAEIVGNVFAWCGANGVALGYAYRTGSRVQSNTSCFNGGSGFVSTPYDYEEQIWSGNIAYGNRGYGISSPQLGAVTFSCNDWFGNQMGNVQGMLFPSADASIEPEFCGAAAGDFHLSATSPLVEWQGCGQIGALGVGCGSAIKGRAKARPRLGLAEVTPNPGSGPVRVAFVLERAALIEIDVFDVLGRRVASPARGLWPAGTHQVEWNGLERSGQPAPPGVYVVRFAHPGGRDRRSIVRVR